MGSAIQGASPTLSYRSSGRVLFQPERPVFSLMEGFVSENSPTVAEQLTQQILIQIRDNLAAMVKKQDEFGAEQHRQSERIVKLEVRDERFARLETELAHEKARVDTLVRDMDKRDGAIGVWSWLSKHWPFAILSGALGTLVAYANGLLDGGKP